ncbi:hypothetical protein THER_1251 [Thermodesulfovibrio sp. N1]|nr:hypothetical protein THER_1251 [Thermodesulfovibrio sp. N1]
MIKLYKIKDDKKRKFFKENRVKNKKLKIFTKNHYKKAIYLQI